MAVAKPKYRNSPIIDAKITIVMRTTAPDATLTKHDWAKRYVIYIKA